MREQGEPLLYARSGRTNAQAQTRAKARITLKSKSSSGGQRREVKGGTTCERTGSVRRRSQSVAARVELWGCRRGSRRSAKRRPFSRERRGGRAARDATLCDRSNEEIIESTESEADAETGEGGVLWLHGGPVSRTTGREWTTGSFVIRAAARSGGGQQERTDLARAGSGDAMVVGDGLLAASSRRRDTAWTRRWHGGVRRGKAR